MESKMETAVPRNANTEICLIRGTGAFLGRSANHSLVIDRPVGHAGGDGLGFRGSQLLSMAIGGCLANSLQEIAHERGVVLTDLVLQIALSNHPERGRISGAAVSLMICADATNPAIEAIIEGALSCWTVGLSLQPAFPVVLNEIQINKSAV